MPKAFFTILKEILWEIGNESFGSKLRAKTESAIKFCA